MGNKGLFFNDTEEKKRIDYHIRNNILFLKRIDYHIRQYILFVKKIDYWKEYQLKIMFNHAK